MVSVKFTLEEIAEIKILCARTLVSWVVRSGCLCGWLVEKSFPAQLLMLCASDPGCFCGKTCKVLQYLLKFW